MYYEKWQRFDPLGTQFIRYEQLSDFVDGLEAPLRISKPNHLALVALDLPICEDNRMHCVDILDGLTKYFLGTLDTSLENGETDTSVDIKKDRPKDYRPITTTVQRQRETYLIRLGLRGLRANVKRRRLQREIREPVLERATIDELVELDDLATPKSTISERSKIHNSDSISKISIKEERERTLSETSSTCSFGGRSLC